MNVYTTFSSSGAKTSLTAGDANLNEVNFAFINMGQGDCTIISCPDNSVYIVDCGSSGGLRDDSFAAAQKLVRAWANGKSVNMILTHPDKDHYNKFLDLLGSEPKVPVDVLYFSRAYSATSPLGYYKETALGRNLSHFGNPLLKEVTLNSTTHSTKTWLNVTDYQVVMGPYDIPATGYVLNSGVVGEDKAWSITIVAGNVKTTSGITSIKSNVVSICTVVVLGTEKLVLTGDATTETMAYLLSSQSGHISNATIFQVPHHGSADSAPTNPFKNAVDPESLLVSVGLLNDSYNLPRYSVLSTWSTATRLGTTSRVMDYWKTPGEMPEGQYNTSKKLDAILTGPWKDYPYYNNNSKTFFWLKDPADAGPTKSNTGFYGFTNTGYFLYRVTMAKDIYETGILGTEEQGFQ